MKIMFFLIKTIMNIKSIRYFLSNDKHIEYARMHIQNYGSNYMSTFLTAQPLLTKSCIILGDFICKVLNLYFLALSFES